MLHSLSRHNDHIGPQAVLNLHRGLGTEKDTIAVHGRSEGDAFLRQGTPVTQAEYLKSPRIRQDGAVPVHKSMQAAVIGNHIGAGPKHQMEGVGQDHLGPGDAQFLGGHGLDRAARAHRHEGRGLHLAMPQAQPAAARIAVAVQDVEFHRKSPRNLKTRR